MKYSIITINFNNRDGLRRTIESVLNQTCKDFEYIVIDGGSTDGSVEVIKEYANCIDYWVSEPDKGIYNAMNKGILQAHGDYLNFMNSGDCFFNSMVLSDMLESKEADIIVGRVANRGTDGSLLSYNREAKTMSMYHFFISTLPHQGCFIKRSLFIGHLYDESLRIVSDWKFFMECVVFRGCEVFKVNVIVASCEERGASGDMSALLAEKETVLKEMLPIGIYNDYHTLANLGVDSYDNLIYIMRSLGLRRFLHRMMKVIVFFHRLFH